MAVTIHPADGFIHRLLQQHGRSPQQSVNTLSSQSRVDERINFSDLARDAQKDQSTNKLEQKLLQLYNKQGL